MNKAKELHSVKLYMYVITMLFVNNIQNLNRQYIQNKRLYQCRFLPYLENLIKSLINCHNISNY